jgi:Protein of unknown function (DUF2849)
MKLPFILVAHDLLTGLVVYWDGKHWQSDLQQAFLAKTDDEASALEAQGKTDLQNNKVIDVALVDVSLTPHITPNHYREKIKTSGLTIKAF